MMRETEIGLAAAEAVGSKYDEACKSLFQNREIIAPVLKEVVPEYKNSAVEEIIQYIDADSIEDLPVDDVSAQAMQLPVPIFDYLSGVFRCDKEKIMEYVDIQSNEVMLKEVDKMTGLGQTIMLNAMQEGIQKGMQKGEDLVATLVSCLMRDNRLDELQRISDEELRKQLYKEYNLID